MSLAISKSHNLFKEKDPSSIKSKIIGDWPGLEKKNLFEGRDLDSSIDARSIYASILARVLDSEHKQIVKNAFFNANLPDMTQRIFG